MFLCHDFYCNCVVCFSELARLAVGEICHGTVTKMNDLGAICCLDNGVNAIALKDNLKGESAYCGRSLQYASVIHNIFPSPVVLSQDCLNFICFTLINTKRAL